jgi:predicted DNA-binding transcriptional regulator YafY
VDRIDNPRPSTIRFVPHDPPDAAAFVANAVAAAPYRFLARVIVHAPAQEVADRIPPTAGVVETIDEDRCLLTTGADSVAFIAMHLALLGNAFTALEPPELIEELRVLAERLAGAYEASRYRVFHKSRVGGL